MTFRRLTLLVVPPANAGLSTGGRSCPHCRSSVFHVARRLPDLLVNLFVPIERYRCISMQCSWEGNLRAKRSVLLPQPLS